MPPITGSVSQNESGRPEHPWQSDPGFSTKVRTLRWALSLGHLEVTTYHPRLDGMLVRLEQGKADVNLSLAEPEEASDAIQEALGATGHDLAKCG